VLEIESAGVGERRGEGYGQVLLNPPLLSGEIRSWAPASKDSQANRQTNMTVKPFSGAETELGELIEEAAWREAIRRAVLRGTADMAQRGNIFRFTEESPKSSQLQSFRGILRHLAGPNEDTPMNWLDHLKNTPSRKDKWPGSGKEGSLARIESLLQDRNWVWNQLESNAGWEDPPTLVRTPEQMRTLFWAEAVRSLVDAAVRAQKRGAEEKRPVNHSAQRSGGS
jgi:CRISPR-associated protein Csx10